MRHSRIFVAATLAIAVVWAGCATKQEPPPTPEDQEAAQVISACQSVGQEVSKRPLPSGLPSDWDKRIPIPPQARVAKVSDPDGSVRYVEFDVPESYEKTKGFYESELKNAGFDLGKGYSNENGFALPFLTCGVSDTVSIYRPQQSSSTSVRIVYVLYKKLRSGSFATSQYLERQHKAFEEMNRGQPPPNPGF